MSSRTKTNLNNLFATAVVIFALSSSLYYWTTGLLHSPLLKPKIRDEQKYLQKYIEDNSLDFQQEKKLAQGYWLRYQDVRDNNYWGENGPMGIWGARDHYMQHGRREGRIFKKVIQPKDTTKEKELAEAYWTRYPEIRSNAVWGEKSKLGILGPRDHYEYRGRHQGMVWGLEKEQ